MLGSEDHTASVWSVPRVATVGPVRPAVATAPQHLLTGHTAPVLCVAFSGVTATGSADHCTRPRLQGQTQLGSHANQSSPPTQHARSAAVRIWSPSSGACLQVLEQHAGPVTGCVFHPTDDSLVSVSRAAEITRWRPAATGASRQYEHQSTNSTVHAVWRGTRAPAVRRAGRAKVS